MSTACVNYGGNGILILAIIGMLIVLSSLSFFPSRSYTSDGHNFTCVNTTNSTHLRGLNNVALWQQKALSANSTSTPENTMDPELMWSLIGIVVFAVFCVFIYCIVAICRACRCHSLILRRPPEHS